MKRERLTEARTAAWIDASGRASVSIPPERIRPKGANPADYADGGDLEVRLLPCSDPGDHRIVSVKHDQESFTSLSTYPRSRIPVGYEGNYRLDDLPYAVFVWNRSITAFAIVHPEKTADKWVHIPVERRRPTGYISKYVGLFCPVELVTHWREDDTPEATRRLWYLKAGLTATGGRP